MTSMETAQKMLAIFAQLTDEQKVAAIEMARCIAEGVTSDDPQIAALMARHGEAGK